MRRSLVYIAVVLALLSLPAGAFADGFIAVGSGNIIIGFGGGCRPLPPSLMGALPPQYWGGPPVFGGPPIFGGPQFLPPRRFCPQPYGWGGPMPGFLPGPPDNWRTYSESGPRGVHTSGWVRGHDPYGGTWRMSFDGPQRW